MSTSIRCDKCVAAKLKMKELESQLKDYKQRLDSLRLAKNTTVLKRDREVLYVTAPTAASRYKSSSNDEKDAITQANKTEVKDGASELQQIPCQHEEEIQQLLERLDELYSENSAMATQNTELQEQVTRLTIDLSLKEAQWCEQEEKLNLKLKLQWGEKYAEKIARMEAKLQQLQDTNEHLTSELMKTHNSTSTSTDSRQQ